MFPVNAKIPLIICSVALIILGLFLSLYSRVIFQEGNPLPLVTAIGSLWVPGSDMVKVSGLENTYMTNSAEGANIVNAYMKERGYTFTEQMGSGFFFRSPDGGGVVVTQRHYTRFYLLWYIAE